MIRGYGNLSFELVVVIVVGSMIAGAVDVLRQPGWAWKQAEENKPAYFVLVLLVPLIGLGMYGRIARPKVKAIAAAGRAASLPFERFGDDALQAQLEDDWPVETVAAPERFTSLGATMIADGEIRLVESTTGPARPGPGDGPFGGGGGSTLTATAPVGLARTYRPQQRTSLPDFSSGRAAAGGGSGRMEGRPDRPAPVPLLGRIDVDRERRRPRRAVEGCSDLLTIRRSGRAGTPVPTGSVGPDGSVWPPGSRAPSRPRGR